MWFQVELPQAGDDYRSAVRRRRARRRRARPRRPRGASGCRAWWCARRAATGRGHAPPLRPAAPQRGAAPGGGRGGAPVFGSFPIGYKVQLSMDGKTWGAPVAQGEGAPATTIATFRPVQAKFVRVTQTGRPRAPRPGRC